MRRGCISQGETNCDQCHRTIPYPERYLIIEEAEGAESHLCIDCCREKGYAHSKMEKRKEVLTLLEE